MTALVILSSLGGVTAFLTGVWLVIKAILKNVNATRENTEALDRITKNFADLSGTVANNVTRIAILEDRIRR